MAMYGSAGPISALKRKRPRSPPGGPRARVELRHWDEGAITLVGHPTMLFGGAGSLSVPVLDHLMVPKAGCA